MLPYKKPSYSILAGALFFVIAGILFVYTPETFTTTRMPSETFIRIGGIASVLFFGFCFVVLARERWKGKR